MIILYCWVCRWVKSEKIPLHTPLEEDGDGSGRRDSVFFTTVREIDK